MAFSIGAVTAKVTADVTDFQKGIKQAQQSVSGFQGKVQTLGSNLTNLGKKMSVASAIVGTGLTLFLKDASKEANNLERALTTLDIISERFGVSGEKAKQSAQDLGRELRIGVGAAASGLQNLLKAGLNLDEATDMLQRFANEALTGKSNSISLAQAVENLSFSYATNNSAIGNLSGISENYINIIEQGKEALIAEGVAVEDITEDMAKYKGMIDLTNLTMGSSERFHGTLIDKQAQLDQSLLDLKVSFGQLINPYLADLVDMLKNLVNWFNNLSDGQKKTIVVIGLVISILGPLLIVLGFLVSGITAVITVVGFLGAAMAFLAANPIVLIIAAIVALIAAGIWLITHWDEVMEFATKMWAHIVSGWNLLVSRVKEKGKGLLDAIMWPFNEAKKKIEEAVNWIKDKMDFTKRQSPSVVDIVNRGVREVNKAMDGLDFNTNLSPNITAAGVGTGGANVNNVTVNLPNALITDQLGAARMGEIVGDGIIKKLKQNIRI